jgi:hypothetical protein
MGRRAFGSILRRDRRRACVGSRQTTASRELIAAVSECIDLGAEHIGRPTGTDSRA